MFRKSIIVLIVLLAAGAGGYYWYSTQRAEPPAPPSTVSVARADVETTVLASGVVEASRLTSVGAEVSGRIETLSVDVGDKVSQGDVIAQIDSTDQEIEVQSAQASLAQIEAEIKGKDAEIVSLKAEAERQQGLLDRGATTSADAVSAQSDYEVALAAREALDAQQTSAELALSTAQTALERTKISSPADGTVVAVVNNEGTTVNANNETPTIVKIADLEQMHVVASVSEADVAGVKAGDKVRFTLAGLPGQTFETELESVAPAPASIADDDEIDTDEAIYYEVQMTVPNPEGQLRIGMTAEVTIILDSAEDALSLPISAVTGDVSSGTAKLMVMGDGAPEMRDVVLGLQGDDRIVVTSGLSEGDKVIVPDSSMPAPPADGASSSSRGGPGGMPPGGPMGF